jgi:hypothetical protein
MHASTLRRLWDFLFVSLLPLLSPHNSTARDNPAPVPTPPTHTRLQNDVNDPRTSAQGCDNSNDPSAVTVEPKTAECENEVGNESNMGARGDRESEERRGRGERAGVRGGGCRGPGGAERSRRVIYNPNKARALPGALTSPGRPPSPVDPGASSLQLLPRAALGLRSPIQPPASNKPNNLINCREANRNTGGWRLGLAAGVCDPTTIIRPHDHHSTPTIISKSLNLPAQRRIHFKSFINFSTEIYHNPNILH